MKLMANKYDFPGHDPRLPGTYQLLLDIAKDPKASAAIKVAALAAASKVEPRYIINPVEFPSNASIEELQAFKVIISQRELRGELDRDTALRALARADSMIYDKRQDQATVRADAELEIKRLNAAADPNQTQHIVISGGLPTLPGCENLIMPQINGHTTIDPNGNLIPQPKQSDEPKPALPADVSLPMHQKRHYNRGPHRSGEYEWINGGWVKAEDDVP